TGFSVTASNAGGTSPAASVEATVEHAPEAPTVTSPAPGSTVGPRPTFSGSAEPGSTVVVTDAEGNAVCRATANAQGAWSCTPADDLPEGATSFSVTASNAGGESPAASVEATVEHAPEAPTVTSPAPGSTVGPRPTFSGSAAPGSTVVVTDAEGNAVCRATADANGNWRCAPSSDLPEGTNRFSVTATDPQGRTSEATTHEITVDTSDLPSAPTIERPAAGATTSPQPIMSGTAAPGSTVIVEDSAGNELCRARVGANDTWACGSNVVLPDGPQRIHARRIDPQGVSSPQTTRELTVDADAAPDRPLLRQPAADSTVGPRPRFSGVAAPGTTVRVRDAEGNTLCSAFVGSHGIWSCTASQDLPNGPQSLAATVHDTAGKTSPATSRDVTVDGVPPEPPIVTQPAAGATVGERPTFSGTAEPQSTVAVRDRAGNLLCSATADADGAWACASNRDLPAGEGGVEVTATDPVGNRSTANTRDLVVDPSHDPDAAWLNSPASDGTVSPRPTINGVAAPGSTVTVQDAAGTTLCSTTATTNGVWACVPSTPLPEGEQSLRVVVTSPSGATSAATTRSFTVDPTAGPTAPMLISPSPGSSNALRPIFSGNAEPGTTASVEDSLGNLLCRSIVANDGTWSCQPSYDLELGFTQVIISVSDAEGQHSPTITRSFMTFFQVILPIVVVS
ncbi:Ig-like domain-containing protein, partial [Candidatus Viridilinea mediisalina]